jgi:hypothetical protein
VGGWGGGSRGGARVPLGLSIGGRKVLVTLLLLYFSLVCVCVCVRARACVCAVGGGPFTTVGVGKWRVV